MAWSGRARKDGWIRRPEGVRCGPLSATVESLRSSSPPHMPDSNPALTPAERRRTFAIISHPDAGKTTLTEKLLLFGGAVQEAGAVKARGERRRARSDWMAIEQARGISVTASVM